MKYRKKPIVIDAFQWTGKPQTYPNWIDEATLTNDPNTNAICMEIKTLEGTMLARPGDWIIRGVKGEIYPCKPDIFAATYEEVKDPTLCKEIGCETKREDGYSTCPLHTEEHRLDRIMDDQQ